MKSRYNNHLKRAVIILFMLFGLLFAAVTAALWYLEFPVEAGIIAAVVIVGLQYVLSPYILPLILKIKLLNRDQEPFFSEETLGFIHKVCRENRLPLPRFGMVEDGNPNAFVYGHFKWDARLVVTRGLMDILDEDEQRAVIAHELGHIRNNDFILMSLVSLIPLILYQIFSWTRRGNKESMVYWVGLGAYGAYILSQFFVLAFSRAREYYADNFSKVILGDGEALKSALVKIAYGFVKDEGKNKSKAAIIGIASAVQSEAFFLANYGNETSKEAAYKKLIGWDIRNVWGKWYELNSTHPLTAKRIMALSNEGIAVEKPGLKDFARFLFEAFIKLLPWAIAAVAVIANLGKLGTSKVLVTILLTAWNQPLNLVLIGASILLLYYYSYSSRFTAESIERLLLREDASPVKGIPAILEGRIIGKGIPGLLWSEDVVLDDGTGIMLVDYRQPFRFLEFLFGILAVDDLKDRNARVIGWYKRGIKPYFVCKHILADSKKYISYVYVLQKLSGYAFIIAGLILFILKRF